MREASWNASGWANWKVGEKSSSAAWRWIASTIGLAVVAGVAAPQRRGAVEDLAPLGRVIVHVLGAGDQARALLEGAVRRERQPEGFEIVGDVGAGGGGRGDGGGHGNS